MIPRSRSWAGSLLALLLAVPAVAQVDRAALVKRQQDGAAALPVAQARAKAACAAARAALGDPDNKVQGLLDEVANKIEGNDFDAALGAQRMAVEQTPEYVAEAARAATLAALAALAGELQAASLAVARADALAEVVARLEQLEVDQAEQRDCSGLLRDLAATSAKLRRAQALPGAEQAGLEVELARRCTASAAKLAAEQAAFAAEQFAQLEAGWSELERDLRSSVGATRDSGFSRFDDALRAIDIALAQVPDADPATAGLRPRLAKLRATAQAIYAASYGGATAERVRGVFDNYASEFEAWETEAATITAAGYVDIDGSAVAQVNHPRTAALLARACQWFTFLAVDDDYQRAAGHPPVRAVVDPIGRACAAATERLAKVATALVEEVAATPPADDRARDRVAVLADWDLRILLQDAAPQWPLVDRLHRVLMTYDGKAAGPEAALAKARAEAVAAAEALWTRMTQIQPLAPGFEPALAGKWSGQLVRLLDVRDRRTEFVAPAADLVFDLDGVVFAASYQPDVKAWLTQELARLQLPPVATEAIELLAVVEGQEPLRLRGPKGADDGVDVLARRVRVVGLRSTAIAFARR